MAEGERMSSDIDYIEPLVRVRPTPTRGRPRLGRTLVAVGTGIVLAFLIAVPLLFMLYGSLLAPGPLGSLEPNFSLENLERVYTTPTYLVSLVGTVGMALTVGVLATAIGALFAWLVTRTNVALPRMMSAVALAPLFISPFLGALAWLLIGSPRSGSINILLSTWFGLPVDTIDITGLGGTVFVLTTYYIPYAFLFIRPALENSDSSLDEASRINGASGIRTLFRVTLPLLRPSLAGSVLFIALLAAGVFSVPSMLGTGEQFTPLSVLIQRTAASGSNFSLAAAVGTELMVLTLVGMYLFRRSTRHSARFVTLSGKATRQKPLDLRGFRYVLGALGLAYGFIAVVLPYAGLILVAMSPYANTDPTRARFEFDRVFQILGSSYLQEAMVNTVIVGLVTAVIAVVLGVLVGYIVLRFRMRGIAALDYLASLPIAIPGIVFGIGLVWMYVRTEVYGTLLILILAFVATYLPQTVRVTSSSLVQAGVALEEASFVNGASTLRTVWRINLPLARSALFASGVMAFVFSSRELSSAVVLYGPDTRILSVLTWDYIQFGDLQTASVIGLVQAIVSIAVVAVARVALRGKATGALT
jgi:iron(III) transport system permease protein